MSTLTVVVVAAVVTNSPGAQLPGYSAMQKINPLSWYHAWFVLDFPSFVVWPAGGELEAVDVTPQWCLAAGWWRRQRDVGTGNRLSSSGTSAGAF